MGWLSAPFPISPPLRPWIHQLLAPLPLSLLLCPGECCLASPGSKLLLSHLLVDSPAVTVHISLRSRPPPEIPRWLPVLLSEEDQELQLCKTPAPPVWSG